MHGEIPPSLNPIALHIYRYPTLRKFREFFRIFDEVQRVGSFYQHESRYREPICQLNAIVVFAISQNQQRLVWGLLPWAIVFNNSCFSHQLSLV